MPSVALAYGGISTASTTSMGTDERRLVEVVDYLRGAGRRRLILLAMPLALLVLAVPWALSQPQEFRTVSTVTVQPSTGFSGPSAIRSFVDTFVQVSESSAVLERAATESGVPVSDFRGSLSVTPVGGSPLVEVEVTTPNRSDGESVTGALIRAALAIPLDSLIVQSKSELQAVRNDAERVVDRLDAVVSESGELLPPEAYRIAAAEVARIEAALAPGGSGQGGGDVTEFDLAAAQEELRDARQAYQDYQALVVKASQKQNQVTIVEARLSQFEERKNDIGGAVFDSVTKPVSQRPLLIQAVVAALVAGLLAAAACLVLIERLRGRRSGPAADQAGDGAPEPPPGPRRPPQVAVVEPTLRKAPPADALRAMGASRDR